jgi:hypothetical protein
MNRATPIKYASEMIILRGLVRCTHGNYLDAPTKVLYQARVGSILHQFAQDNDHL